MVNQKELTQIIKQIGQPDSEKIEYLIERIKLLDKHNIHCATVALCLAGCNQLFQYDSNPLSGLWAQDYNLTFLKKSSSIDYLIIPKVDDPAELKVGEGYFINENDPTSVKVALDGGGCI